MLLSKMHISVQKCVYVIPVESLPEQKNLIMWVRIENLPLDLTLDPNARRADVESKVAKKIIATLRDSPENFWKLNNGIQMTARDVEVKDGRQVNLTMFDAEDDDGVSDGVINGGHTYECIKKVIRDLKDEADASPNAAVREQCRAMLVEVKSAMVRVEVLTGLGRDELPDISLARNTGETVKKFSLQNLKGLYDPIKKVLGDEESKRVGFCENDVDIVPGTTYQVTELIRLMCLFNNELYPPSQDKHPVICYTSAGRLVEKWDAEVETFKPLIPKLPELMRLYDLVYQMLCDWRRREGKAGLRNGFEPKDDFFLSFTRQKAAYRISLAFVLPILAALRILLDEQSNWRVAPEAFLRVAGPDLVSVLMQFYDEQCKSKPHLLGRASGAWRAVLMSARVRVAEEELAQSRVAHR